MLQKVDKVHIGIDVSKEKLAIHIHETGVFEEISNETSSIKSYFSKVLNRYGIELVALEYTGGFEWKAIEQLEKMGVAIHLAHPLRVHHYFKALNQMAKTDPCDAAGLARYATESYIKQSIIPSMWHRKLRALVLRRMHIIEYIETEKKRRTMLEELLGKKEFNTLINQLETMLEKIEKKIIAQIESNQQWLVMYQSLQGIKGVGKATAASLIAFVPQLGSLNRREIASLLGVAPFNRDSGKRAGYRFTKGGREYARKSLYMAALVGTRYNDVLKAFYQHLQAQGKCKKKALIAVMRKLLTYINSIAREALLSCPVDLNLQNGKC